MPMGFLLKLVLEIFMDQNLLEKVIKNVPKIDL
jgi:hypothetical protein